MKHLRGIAASNGIAIGPAFIYRVELPKVPIKNDVDTVAELERFEQSVSAVRVKLEKIEERKRGQIHAENLEILEIQKELLVDEEYGGQIRHRIERRGMNAEAAILEVTNIVVAEFSALEDEYFRQRAADVADLGGRLLRFLMGIADLDLSGLSEPVVIMAHDLSPSDTIGLATDKVLAMCTEVGSSTSHTAIVARSMGIPALVGVGDLDIAPGDTVVLDGYEGVCIANPDEITLQTYYAKREQDAIRRKELLLVADKPAITSDGVHVQCVANVGGLESAQSAAARGADGIGLLRSEFLFLDRSDLPNEDEQYRAYTAVANCFPDAHVVVRTLDIGGDKPMPAMQLPEEENPFLGHRAIRLTLEHDSLFYPQIRALLRSAADRDIRIMIPFICTVSELREAKEKILQVHKSMKAAHIPVCDTPHIGIMVEIPSTAILADIFAAEADFFSIGTNDLCQYTLAADRTNAKVADRADFLDPAVLYLIKRSIDAAHNAGIPVAMCGEMAGSIIATPLLLGMGLKELSMSASQLPEIKNAIHQLNFAECSRLVESCLHCATAAEVRTILEEFIEQTSLLNSIASAAFHGASRQ